MRARLPLVVLIVAGGLGVLGSYWWGVSVYPEASARAWGGVPEWLKPYYVVSMLLAAAGFFPFTWFVLFRLDPARVRVAGFGYGLFVALYALVLLPSALWMPLTFAMLDSPSALLWIAIRTVLFAVGAGSVGILTALFAAAPSPRGPLFSLAVVGAIAFCVQTALLDALVWPAYF